MSFFLKHRNTSFLIKQFLCILQQLFIVSICHLNTTPVFLEVLGKEIPIFTFATLNNKVEEKKKNTNPECLSF